jgi:hypothetical protein
MCDRKRRCTPGRLRPSRNQDARNANPDRNAIDKFLRGTRFRSWGRNVIENSIPLVGIHLLLPGGQSRHVGVLLVAPENMEALSLTL